MWTSDVRSGGTDANVFIQMYGEDGKTEEYKLRNRTDNFEQGQVDKFKVGTRLVNCSYVVSLWCYVPGKVSKTLKLLTASLL